ncbi:armadillo-type protein [Chytriomyces sp. MP71]|nr:armadillo-type protein [Chytriomyces sp. MP71]
MDGETPTTSGKEKAEKDKVTNPMRLEMKGLNADAQRPTASEMRTLDGALKKTQGFMRKIKTLLTADGVEALKKEALTLKLEKYVDEIAVAIAETGVAAKRGADAWAAVDFASLMHRRFEGFDTLVVAAIQKYLGPVPKTDALSPEQKDRDEAVRVAKQRMALRILTEFYLVGLARDTNKELLVPATLRPMFNAATDDKFANASIAQHFCKTFSDVFFADKGLSEESIVKDTVRVAVRSIVVDYYTPMSKYLIKMHKHIKKAEVSNYEHAVSRGEVSEERQERFQRGIKIYEKLVANVQSLSASLGAEMPDLPEPETALEKLMGIGISYSGSKETDDQEALLGGPWEDEESRSFYESLLDLKDMVPAILLGEKKERPAPPTAADLEKLNNVIQVTDEVIAGTLDKPDDASKLEDDAAAGDEPEDEEDATAGDDERERNVPGATGGKGDVDAFFTALPNALSVEAIDKLAVQFCFINRKTSRKRLIQTLATVPRQRLDVLPYYSRLIATLSPFMPDVSEKVLAALEKEFHFHQKKTDRTFVEEKVKVVRYIGELTKFKIPPYHVTFHVFKVLLESFTNHNIEAICSLLEVCGRFLYKTPETSKPTSNVLEIMMKKKQALNLDSRMALLIDNAFYQCNPPEKTAIKQKERSPMDLYIRKLIYTDLSKKNAERILKQLRKLNWNDPETVRLIRMRFFKCWKVKFSNLHVLALLTYELSRYYPAFGVAVVDACLEEVRLGLETNIFKHNQRRVSTVRFLGELYNYRMIESNIVFDTLYILLRFGYESPFPEPGVFSPWDAPHDFFRVRLCVVLLETCGQCFDRGYLAQKLDEFLAFLQVYLHSKPRLSMDVEFLMRELFELLRPKQALCTSYEEAVDAFNVLAMRHAALSGERMVEVVAAVGAEEHSSDDEEDGLRAGARMDEDDDEAVGEDEEEDDALGDEVQDAEEEEDVVVHLPEQRAEVDKELEDEFEKEFSKMMQDSLDSRKYDKKKDVFDVAIPVKKAVAFQGSGATEAGGEGVVFSFLTKKGNKQQVKAVELPQDSSFVRKTKEKQEADRLEKQQLKKLVLSYEDREETETSGAGKARKPHLLHTNDRQRNPPPGTPQYKAFNAQLQ